VDTKTNEEILNIIVQEDRKILNTPQDSSLHHFLTQSVTMYSARAVTLVISYTLIVHVTYTYLLTY